jgi:soluble lytic murein transglycosylase-like protein
VPAGLEQADAALRRALRDWRAQEPALRGSPPAAVLTAAARERGLVHQLSKQRPAQVKRVLAALPGPLHRAIGADVAAARALRRLSGPSTGSHTLHLVAPAPAGDLLADYRAAQRRFGVDWQVLAAVNLIESAFGRVVNHSSAGAQGPMQFMPATWRAYGLGGDVHNSRDAIMGAANYLHQSGAPANTAAALYAYNRSHLYVAAVLAYADQMRRDPLAFLAYYAWEASLPATIVT